MDPTELKNLMHDFGDGIEAFKAEHIARVDQLEAKMNRLGLTGGGALGGGEAFETKAAVNRALRDFMRTGDVRTLTESKAMQVSVDPDGGYLTMPVVNTSISNRLRELSPMRQYARIISMPSGDAFEEPGEASSA